MDEIIYLVKFNKKKTTTRSCLFRGESTCLYTHTPKKKCPLFLIRVVYTCKKGVILQANRHPAVLKTLYFSLHSLHIRECPFVIIIISFNNVNYKKKTIFLFYSGSKWKTTEEYRHDTSGSFKRYERRTRKSIKGSCCCRWSIWVSDLIDLFDLNNFKIRILQKKLTNVQGVVIELSRQG